VQGWCLCLCLCLNISLTPPTHIHTHSADEPDGPYRPWNLIGASHNGSPEEPAERWEWGLGKRVVHDRTDSYFKFVKIDKQLHLVCDWGTQVSSELRARALSADWAVSSKALHKQALDSSPSPSKGHSSAARHADSSSSVRKAQQAEGWDLSAPPLLAVAIPVSGEMDRSTGTATDAGVGAMDVQLFLDPALEAPKGGRMAQRLQQQADEDSDEEYYYGPHDPPNLRRKNGRFETCATVGGCCLYIVGCISCLGIMIGQTAESGGSGGSSCTDSISDFFENCYNCGCFECEGGCCDCCCDCG